MKVPVKPEEGSQNVCFLSRPHQHPGLLLLPLLKVSLSRSGALPAPASSVRAEEGQSASVPMSLLSQVSATSQQAQMALTSQIACTLLMSPTPFPKFCTSFSGVSSCFDAANSLANTKTASNPRSSLEKGAVTVLGVPQALSFAHAYVRVVSLCWY